MTQKPDIYTRVTNKIIADLEKGDLTWMKPWNTDHLDGRVTKPLRSNGDAYQGMNVLMLWAAAVDRGFTSNIWMTYRQAKELGGQVQKGSTGEPVVYANSFRKDEERYDEDAGQWQSVEIERRFLKTYTVFNTEQIEGLPPHFYARPEPVNPEISRDAELEAFFGQQGADLRHGGSQAYYAIKPDYVQMPHFETFRDSESYYATLAHEMVHWTRHPSRLDREFGRKQWGDEGYAREELVAEIGAAFLCAELGITPETREDHAAYIESWLTVLKNDKRAIFAAAAHAQRASALLQAYACQKAA